MTYGQWDRLSERAKGADHQVGPLCIILQAAARRWRLFVRRPHVDPAPGRVAGNDAALRVHDEEARLAPGARFLTTASHGTEDVALAVDLQKLAVQACARPHAAETVEVDRAHQ